MISGYLISGKTGTQTDAPRVLTNGYTPDIAASAIISSDKFHPMFAGKKMSGLPQLAGLTVHGTQYRRGYTLSGSSGSEAGGRLWKPAMLKVLPLLPHTEFVRPENSPYAHVDTNSGIGSMWAYFGKTDPSAVPTPAPQPQPPKPQKPGAVTTITPTPTP
jgi:membrane carboxypeptidase/penicillin-binding protein